MSGQIHVVLYERERQEKLAYLGAAAQRERSEQTVAAYRDLLFDYYGKPALELMPSFPADIINSIVSMLDTSLEIATSADVLSFEFQWRQGHVMDVLLYDPKSAQAVASEAESKSSDDASSSPATSSSSSTSSSNIRLTPPSLPLIHPHVPNLLFKIHYEQFRGWPDNLDEFMWSDSSRIMPPQSLVKSYQQRTEAVTLFQLSRDGLEAARDILHALQAAGAHWPNLLPNSYVRQEMKERLLTATANVAKLDLTDALRRLGCQSEPFACREAEYSRIERVRAEQGDDDEVVALPPRDLELPLIMSLILYQIKLTALNRSIERSM